MCLKRYHSPLSVIVAGHELLLMHYAQRTVLKGVVFYLCAFQRTEINSPSSTDGIETVIRQYMQQHISGASLQDEVWR